MAAGRWAPRSRDESVTRLPDAVGALLLAAGIGSLVLGIVEGPGWGWSAGSTIACGIVTVACIAGFVFSSRHHEAPIIQPAVIRVRAFAWSNATALLFALAFAASLLSVILWMQEVWGYSAIRTGLAVSPGPLMVPIFATFAHQLTRRIPVGIIVAIGCLFSAAGTFIIAASVGPVPHYATEMLPGWIVGGIGVGLALPPILSSATADLPPSQSATGSGIVSMNRQIGTALGVSVLVAILGVPVGYSAAHAAFQHGSWTLAAFAIAGAFTASGMTPSARRISGQAISPTDASPLPAHVMNLGLVANRQASASGQAIRDDALNRTN